MKSTKQAIENMEYVRRLLAQKQPGFAVCLEFAASLVETSHGATSPSAPPDPARLRLKTAELRGSATGPVRPDRGPSSGERTWSLRNFHQVTPGSGLDIAKVQKMEPIPAHEVIYNSSLVHEWRVAQLTRLGIPTPLAEAVAADVDWHQVAALVHRGCPPRLALRIVQ